MQYCGLDGRSANKTVDLSDEASRRNAYINTDNQVHKYKEVAIGFGKRSDFTKTLSVRADFTYNYDLMGTLKSKLDKKKRSGT